jgi:2-iminobutanoate/2-iminopropanoate deaminase
MKFVSTENAPAAGGHYSQAVAANGFLFVAGQLPIKPGGGMPDGGDPQDRGLRFEPGRECNSLRQQY